VLAPQVLALPGFTEIPGAGFASIDAFLQFQRAAVAGARYAVELDADAAWGALDPAAQRRFVAGAEEFVAQHGQAAAWRRAWWLLAIGGRPRAPFEIGTPTEQAAALMAALAAAFEPHDPPRDRTEEIENWWRALTAQVRAHIARYTAERVHAARRRLAVEGVFGEPIVADEPPTRARSHGKRHRQHSPSRTAIRRLHDADRRAVAAQQALSRRFEPLGPVCGACTRETGGCCSLTVPLLWREADYRLMALGAVEPPAPNDDTPTSCPFLGAAGCRLPAERRPHVCRAFLCEKAEAALGEELQAAWTEIGDLATARSQLTL
jgi:hypothetical protein